MNLQTLSDYIKTFTREVVDSGFKRDVDDYITSLPSVQNNIVTLRQIAAKTVAALDQIYQGDLRDSLSSLLPSKPVRPFTDVDHPSLFRKLADNTQIAQPEFFNQLNQLLNQLKNQLQQNTSEINKIKTFIDPYMTKVEAILAEKNMATVSIVFKEEGTISSLKQFSKTLALWNRTLPVYHQLLTSQSPEDIHIVEVQNGSIDMVINVSVDVAKCLAEVFKAGFQCYAAYLTYKGLLKPITDTYRGDKVLIQGEDEREKQLLEHIGTAIESEVLRQHEEAKTKDKKIHGASLKIAVNEVRGLVASHIINGNDIKLLTMPETDKEESQEALADELRKCSADARSKLDVLPDGDRQKLLKMYRMPEESQKKD
jgi:hypothetical protein